MIETSEAYKAAITGDARRSLLKAVIDITDPDITFNASTDSGHAPWSKDSELHDKVFKTSKRYVTLEPGRWLLDGKGEVLPDDLTTAAQIGFVGDLLSEDDRSYSTAQWVQLNFSNVEILQAFSVFFPDNTIDGLAEDFTVEVLQNGTAYFTQEITGNKSSKVGFAGFTVYTPDAIRVTVKKWSLPRRRIRLPEILPGIYEEWDEDIIAHFDVKQQGDVSCLSIPFGTCTLRMDNFDRRFEPRNKEGIFISIEDRQGIEVSIGTKLQDGSEEYQKIGKFFQYSSGWKTSDNNLTMEWFLVDIVGLLTDREYIPPETLPTNLDGWIKSIVSQLGKNFESFYTIDANYASASVAVNDLEDVTGLKCGDILRFVCMATGTWPRAEAKTGKLAVEPLWSQGNKMDLDNLNSYPVMKANNDIAAVIFTLADGNNTQYVVSGNSTASSETKSVKNPFIHTEAQALAAAKNILSTFGGNRLETVGRGNPSSEIGDVDTVELDESTATTGRRILQTFTFNDGVLQNCQSVLLQADGSFLFQNRAVITENGTWTAPAGVSQLRIIVVNGGTGGTDGTDGTWSSAGKDGVDGVGGKVYAATININEQQAFNVSIGEGGDTGQTGGTTVFGAYSGDNGKLFLPSYTDIANGEAFARTGVLSPADGTGDGGAKGKGGRQGKRRKVKKSDGTVRIVVDHYPGTGGKGKPGAKGCVVVYWDKEAEI